MVQAIPFIALAVSAAAQYKQYSEQKKASQAQKRLADLQARRERREARRRAQVARAQVVAQAEAAQGSQQGSAPLGAQASIASQYAYNISFLDTALQYQKDFIKAQERGATAEAVGKVAQSVGSAFGGYKSIFSQ